jgi:hypothetical protein
MNPNDKPKDKSPDGNETFEDPKLFLVVGDEVFPRVGLETVFADVSEGAEVVENTGKTYGGAVCSCNKVRVVSCGCVGYTSPSGGSGGAGCRCAPVS